MNTRPNIIVILAAGLGAWALETPEIPTPALDRLAAGGTRFERFYAASPASSPARATLLTGLIPSRHGIHDWLSGGHMASEAGPAIRYLDGKVGYTQVLADAGYTCGLSGTWHLGDSATPQQGFTHWFALQGGSGRYHDVPMIRDGVPVVQPGNVTEAITADAVDFIARHHARAAPFHLSVHYPAPHAAWDDSHPAPFRERVAGSAFATLPREPHHPWRVDDDAPEPGSPAWHARLAAWAAAVGAMDAGIAEILALLDRLGLAEDTLVWFLADTGVQLGHHGIWGGGNGTFPLTMYDPALRVPAIARWPGRIPAGIAHAEMLGGYDFAPTLLELAGLRLPDAERLPGRSFASLLDPAQAPDRDHVVVMAEYGPVRAIRTPAWTYVHRFPYGPHELFDVAADPGERVNLVDDAGAREIVTLLRGEMQRWFSRHADPALDGAHEQVTGSGQFLPAGTRNGGVLAYGQSRRIAKTAAGGDRIARDA